MTSHFTHPRSEPLPVTEPGDAEIARRVRAAVDALNAAIDEAQAAGVQVSFGVSTWVGLRPQKSHVSQVRIERPSDWLNDYPGYVL